MEHLEFVDKLDKHGISIRTTNVENKEKEFEEHDMFGKSRKIIVKNLSVRYKESEPGDSTFGKDPMKELIRNAIDMGQWKHSWHNNIEPENYEKFIEIIQEKILSKAAEIDELLTIMFLIRYEIVRQYEK